MGEYEPGRATRAAQRRRLLVASVSVALMACALYAPSLGFQFVWDDEELIFGAQAPTTGPLLAIWGSAFPIGDGAYFRPLVLTLYWLEHLLFGLNPLVFHATQVALHALCCVQVFWLALVLANGKWRTEWRPWALAGPLSAALLFLAHPVHVEAVALVSARTDLMASLFCLSAVLTAVRVATRPKAGLSGWAVLSGVAALAGLLSKEVAIVVPALSYLAMRVRAAPGARSRILTVLGAQGLGIVGYFGLRAFGLGVFGTARELDWGTLSVVLTNVGRSVELLLFPLRLRVYHQLPLGAEAWVLVGAGALAIAATLGLVVIAWRRWERTACGLLWVGVSVLPASGILDIPGAPIAERFLFLPSVGLCLLASEGVRWLASKTVASPKARFTIAAAIAGVALVLGVRTLMRLPVYRSNLALFETVIQESPTFYYGYLGVGIFHQKRAQPERAIPYLENAVRLSGPGRPGDPRRGDANRWLGLSYMSLGRVSDAVVQLEAAEHLRPEDEQLKVNLGSVYVQSDRLGDAERVLRAALALDPDLAEAEANLGILLMSRRAYSKSLSHLQRAAEMLPELPDAHYNLGNAYAQLGRDAEAIAAYRRALQLRPDHAAAGHNLAIVLRRRQEALETK
jgi:tetratricopeptide (TPR) repeat protein